MGADFDPSLPSADLLSASFPEKQPEMVSDSSQPVVGDTGAPGHWAPSWSSWIRVRGWSLMEKALLSALTLNSLKSFSAELFSFRTLPLLSQLIDYLPIIDRGDV